MNCRKCGFEVTSNFCPNCGHSSQAVRFDWKYLSQKFVQSFDLSKGFFFTLKQLVVQPGLSLRQYIRGETSGYSNPIKLFLIVGAVTNFLTYQYSIFTDDLTEPTFYGLALHDLKGYYKYSTRYFSFFTLTAMPFFSLASWLIFIKKGFNYTENLVFNMYVGVGQFLILLVFIPVITYVRGETIVTIYGFFNIGYNIWALLYFFQVVSLRGAFLATLAVLIPQLTVFFLNYFLYRVLPQNFWVFLDNVLT